MSVPMMEISTSEVKAKDAIPPAPRACGMWLVLTAFMLNMFIEEKFANLGLGGLNESVAENGLTVSNAWIGSMNGLLRKIDEDITIKDAQKRAAAVGADTAKLNVQNTLYNQVYSFIDGLKQGLATNQNDVNSTSALQAKTLQESVLVELSKLYA